MRRLSATTALLMSSVAFVTAVHAAPAAEADKTAGVLEEVVVTVERRETKLETTPVSAIAVSSATMEKMRVQNVGSLVTFVPGLKLDGNDPTEMRLALRGVFTSANTPSIEQSVGYFVDGVYYGHTGDLTSDFFDIERVEVLRGPQGTLWGRNVVGGAINVVTKNPTEETEAKITATLGNYNRLELGGRVAGALTDNLFAQVAFKSTEADGYATIIDPLNRGAQDVGKRLGGVDTQSIRAKIRYLPNDKGEIILAADYFNDRTQGPTPRNIVAGGVTTLYPLPESRFETMQKLAGGLNRDIWGVTLHSNWDLDWATLSTITAYRKLDAVVSRFSFDAAPVGAINLARDYTDETFSQEFRLAGSTDNLNWQTGVYYYYDNGYRKESYQEKVEPGTVAALFNIAQTPGNTDAWRIDTGKTNSVAAFGQLTYSFNDWLNLTGGGRYTRDHKSSDPQAYSPVPALNPILVVDPTNPTALPGGGYGFTTHTSATWDSFTPKATLDATFTDLGAFDSLMGFVTFSKGFKSGGFETRVTKAGSEIPVEPEHTTNIEAGFKARFWESRAQFNVTVYQAKYKGMQGLYQPAGQVGFAVFTSDATSKGLETELSVMPVSGLRLNFAYSYTDATYDDGSFSGAVNISGKHLPQAPKHSLSAGFVYTQDVGDLGTINLSTNYGYKSGVYFNPENNIENYVDPVSGKRLIDMTKQSILDASLSFSHENWEISIWGKNLLQNDYLMRAQDPFALWGLRPAEYFSGMKLMTGTWGAPRTYGLTLTWHMN